jgi:hypothetical protein
MIVKLENQFFNSIHSPMMLILSPEEKRAISNMASDQVMIAFYPTDKGYTADLINQWMRDGITLEPAPEQPKPLNLVKDDPIPEYIPPARTSLDQEAQ